MSATPPKNAYSSRWIIYLVAISLAAFYAWATHAEIDQISRAPGTLVAASRNQVIQVMEQAMVDEITVREGDTVQRDQVLMRLDSVRAQAAFQESRGRVAALEATVARLSAEVLAQAQPRFPPIVHEYPDILATQQQLFLKRRAALHEDVAVLRETLQLVQTELELMQPLLAQGDVSQVEVLRLQRQSADLRGRIATRQNKYLEDAQAELTRAQENLAAHTQQMAQHQRVLDNTEIVAPMDGIVRNIRITTRGGVARPGEEVMQIVPIDDGFVIEARVRPVDIGHVRLGLPANVKFDAWDFSIHGAFAGTVTFISADAIREEARTGNEEPFFRVHVKLDDPNPVGRGPTPVHLTPGMTASVEIQSGTNTVWGFLTKPITKTLHGALGER